MINKFITDKAKKKESKTSHGFRRTQKKKNQDFSEKEDAILIEKVNENAEQLFARVSDQVTNKKKKIAMDGSKKKMG